MSENVEKPILLVDLDGVLVDLLSVWIPRLYHPEPVPGDVVINKWNVHECVDMPPSKTYGTLKEPDFPWEDLPPVKGAIAAVNKLKKHFDVRVCTAHAGPYSATGKMLWCKKHSIVEEPNIILTHNKHLIDAWGIVDDKPATLEMCAKKGLATFCYAAPYNAEPISGVTGRGTWPRLAEQIINYKSSENYCYWK